MICNVCGSLGVTKKCGGCLDVSYCSSECQAKDWLAHQNVCMQVYHSEYSWTKFLAQDELQALYDDSKQTLEGIKRFNQPAWLVLCSFLSAAYINTTIQRAKGDWSPKNLEMPYQVMELGKSPKYGFFEDFFRDWILISDHDGSNRSKALERYPALEFLWALPDAEFLRFYIISLNDMIVKLMHPLTSEIIVFRGYYGPNESIASIKPIESYQPGETWTNWSFISTSFDPKVSRMFTDTDCCLMEIHVPEGFHVLLVTTHLKDPERSSYPTSKVALYQAEVLLPPGLIFRFDWLKKNKLGRVTVIGIARPRGK